MVNVIDIDVKINRMLLYRFLADAFTYPQMDFIDTILDDGEWNEISNAVSESETEASLLVDNLRQYIMEQSADKARLLQNLQIEYTYLFINAIPVVPAPPYESVYTGEGLLMGEPVSEVLHLYREAGLRMSNGFMAPADHIAAELEFMFFLIQQEFQAIQDNQLEIAEILVERQKSFLNDHLINWLPAFLEKVKSNSRITFYRDLAELLENVINIDHTTLASQVDVI